ncbi:hypothetical protein [Serratia rhizosphaerae]
MRLTMKNGLMLDAPVTKEMSSAIGWVLRAVAVCVVLYGVAHLALLTGCSATLVSYRSDSDNACPPMVSVQSLGSSVTVTDGTTCKVVGE